MTIIWELSFLEAGRRRLEIRTSASFGINRLKTISEFNSALGWSPLTQALIQNTQQYMDEDIEVKVAGSLLRQAKTVKVLPTDIAGFFDFVPVDGTLPIDRYAIANPGRNSYRCSLGYHLLHKDMTSLASLVDGAAGRFEEY